MMGVCEGECTGHSPGDECDLWNTPGATFPSQHPPGGVRELLASLAWTSPGIL